MIPLLITAFAFVPLDEPVWLDNWPAAQEAARKEGRPIFAVLH